MNPRNNASGGPIISVRAYPIEPATAIVAGQVVKLGLTVAQTEALVDKLRTAIPKRRRPTFIIKDVRLFLNTISRSMELMHSAGVDAKCQREDLEEEIRLTIRIPKSVK